jgi:hypothetical protein
MGLLFKVLIFGLNNTLAEDLLDPSSFQSPSFIAVVLDKVLLLNTAVKI